MASSQTEQPRVSLQSQCEMQRYRLEGWLGCLRQGSQEKSIRTAEIQYSYSVVPHDEEA